MIILDRSVRIYESDRDTFLSLISTAFRSRRKKIVNNLLHWNDYSKEVIVSAMKAANIAPDARAEALDLGEFGALSRELGKHSTVKK